MPFFRNFKFFGKEFHFYITHLSCLSIMNVNDSTSLSLTQSLSLFLWMSFSPIHIHANFCATRSPCTCVRSLGVAEYWRFRFTMHSTGSTFCTIMRQHYIYKCCLSMLKFALGPPVYGIASVSPKMQATSPPLNVTRLREEEDAGGRYAPWNHFSYYHMCKGDDRTADNVVTIWGFCLREQGRSFLCMLVRTYA